MTITDTANVEEHLARLVGSPDAVPDPYPLYHALRAIDPVYRARDGVWYVTGYDAVRELTLDERWSTTDPDIREDRPGSVVRGLARRIIDGMVLFTDGADHVRLRRVLGRTFTKLAAEASRSTIAAAASKCVAELAAHDRIDFHGFIRALPLKIISEILGIEVDDARDYTDLARWTDAYASMLYPNVTAAAQSAADDAFREFCAYIEPVLAQRRSAPRGDLISLFVQAHEEGLLSGDEVPGYILFVIAAGNRTTAGLIANAMLTFVSHRDQWDILCHDTSLVESAVEEVLRYESSGRTLTPRWAKVPIELCGHLIEAGSKMVAIESGANRDPNVFEDPDRFDIQRSGARHVAFGGGAHTCVGQFFARVETQEALRAMARTLPNISLLEPVRWDPSLLSRTSVALWLDTSVQAGARRVYRR